VAIPDYESLMLPLLRLSADGAVHKFSEAVDHLADELALSDEERTELLPSGMQPVFRNRVGWAKSYLKQAGLLTFPKRGLFQITQQGQEVLKNHPERIDNSVLQAFPEFREFKTRRRENEHKAAPEAVESTESPEDKMASAFRRYQSEIEGELLSIVKQVSPSYFEQVVVDMLIAMGYGGNRQDAARAVTKKSGDEGIDGVIKEDRLGLDVIYVQAKRWEGTVGRPEIQKFAGALQGKRASKGVFITTSAFSREAAEFSESINSKIILIDGDKLAQLMIEFNVGVSTTGQYLIKQIDSDYFDQ
jgi:restriction system protein